MVGVKTHKLGIIGFGGIARWHIDTMKDAGYDRVELKGVFDLAESALQAARDRGFIAYPSQEALLADPEIDVVMVATTNEAHKSICMDVMRAGKHVISEKPVTVTSAELEEAMAVSKETGMVYTVDQNRRTNRDFIVMKRSVEAGLIGKPLVIESRVEGSRGMPKGWRTIKRLGGGMMLDWGVHLIDQFLYMIPEKVTQVYCKMLSVQYPEVEDNFHLMMTFESGLIGIIEVGTNHFITHPRWYVMGEQGTLQVDNWNCDGRIVRATTTENEWDEEIIYTMAGPTKTMAPRNKKSTETIALSAPTDVVDDITVVFDQFLDAVEGKAPLTIKPEEALRTMKVMEAAFVSAEEKRSVNVEI